MFSEDLRLAPDEPLDVIQTVFARLGTLAGLAVPVTTFLLIAP